MRNISIVKLALFTKILIPILVGLSLVVFGLLFLKNRVEEQKNPESQEPAEEVVEEESKEEPSGFVALFLNTLSGFQKSQDKVTENISSATGFDVSIQNENQLIENLQDEEFDRTGSVELPSGRVVYDLYTVNSGVTGRYAKKLVEDIVNTYEISPYTGIVTFLDRPSSLKTGNVSDEYVVLKFSDELKRAFTISGWKIFGLNKKVKYTIPGGLRVLGQDSGIQNIEPLVAYRSSVVVVSSGRSPAGSSFRENKCSGYRSQFKRFVPSIKTECPKPLDEFERYGNVPYTDEACYRFVINLKKCTVITKPPAGVTKQCHLFLENILTETGCVRDHKDDDDFLYNKLRVYLDAPSEIWNNKHDAIFLLDNNDKLVTIYVY